MIIPYNVLFRFFSGVKVARAFYGLDIVLAD